MNSCCGTNTSALEGSPPTTRMAPSSTATEVAACCSSTGQPKARQNLTTEFRLPPKKRRVYEKPLEEEESSDSAASLIGDNDETADENGADPMHHSHHLGSKSSIDIENLEFWRSGSAYSFFPPPPMQLRRQVASCWFPSTAQEQQQQQQQQQDGFKTITTQPPSSGSPYYEERYGKRAPLAIYPHGPQRIGSSLLSSPLSSPSSSSTPTLVETDSLLKPLSLPSRMATLEQSRHKASSTKNNGSNYLHSVELRHDPFPPSSAPTADDNSNDMELVAFNHNVNKNHGDNTSCAVAGGNENSLVSVTPSPNQLRSTPTQGDRRSTMDRHHQSRSSDNTNTSSNNKAGAKDASDAAADHQHDRTLESSPCFLSVLEPLSYPEDSNNTIAGHVKTKNHSSNNCSGSSNNSATIEMNHQQRRRRSSSSTDPTASFSSSTTTVPRHSDDTCKVHQPVDDAEDEPEQQKRSSPSSFTATSSIANSAAAVAPATAPAPAATSSVAGAAAKQRGSSTGYSIDLIGKRIGGSRSKIVVPTTTAIRDYSKKLLPLSLPAPVAIRGQELPHVFVPPFSQHPFFHDASSNNTCSKNSHISFHRVDALTSAQHMNGNHVRQQSWNPPPDAPSLAGHGNIRSSDKNHTKHAQASQKKLTKQQEKQQALESIFRPRPLSNGNSSFQKDAPVQDKETVAVSSLPVGTTVAFNKMSTTSSSTTTKTTTATTTVVSPIDSFVETVEVHPLAAPTNSGRFASAFAPGGLGGRGKLERGTSLPIPISSNSEHFTGRQEDARVVVTSHARSSSSDFHITGRRHHHLHYHQHHMTQQYHSVVSAWTLRPGDCDQEPSPASSGASRQQYPPHAHHYHKHPPNVVARRRVSTDDGGGGGTAVSENYVTDDRRPSFSTIHGTTSNSISAHRRVSTDATTTTTASTSITSTNSHHHHHQC